ncbi:reproductive homeobox on X chromosome, 12 [Mus musculus]|uniref:Reproductive homeobox 12 n=1 Tax=Mus musculus TaxID=10090 RepID=Q4TU81_MOUSE|nr:reproductive homeobox on X chromosome, 12 [Mus musculus]AAI32523.1 Reproductive homeobox 12 [Mus musculus]AAI32549.1 Reproductive homeobox 12 [Mus musculus]AAY58260.1 reproductive homeobox on X chromosome 12 [Mus musculus]|eukprot:NP_001020254.1 reproductive homeobox on X chromosome, 12 [Mus musculus]
MALEPHHVDPNFYKLGENEIEVTLDADQEADGAAEGGSFGDGSLNGSDKLKCQGIPDDKDDVIYVGELKNIGNDIKDECHGSHQGSGDPQPEEKQKNSAAARVPQVRRTRPRIQLGFTPRQLNELEDFFEKTKYPDALTRKNLAKHLYLAESKVQRWFKKRRAHYRKEQQSQVLQCASADGQDAMQ